MSGKKTRCGKSSRRCESSSTSSDSFVGNVTFDIGGNECVDIPANGQQSPIASNYSMLSDNKDNTRFLDEIALLKRGKIDRQAPRHPYNRTNKVSSCTKMRLPPDSDESVISDSELSKKSSRRAQATRSSSMASNCSIRTVPMEKLENTTKVQVGGRDENATLVCANVVGGGVRYELSQGNQGCLLQMSPRCLVMVSYKE